MSWDCRRGWLGALAGCLAAILLAAGCAAERPAYLRIAVSEKSIVYLQFQGDELRAAMSVEALPDAKPVPVSVRSREPQEEIEQPVLLDILPSPRYEIALPIPPEQLPPGVTAVQAHVLDGVVALTYCRPDDRNIEWRCRTRWLEYRTGLAAADAPVVEMPDVAKIALAVTAVPARGSLAVGLNLVSGRCEMYLRRMDGRGVAAQVRVLDAAGGEIVRKPAKLDDFGFRCDGPCWSVKVPKGAYVIEASVEAGPFGGALTAEKTIAVP